MLFCETARSTPEIFDDLAVLVTQLRALGIDAALGAGSLPAEISRNTLFDIAALSTQDRPRASDSLLLVRGHEIDDAGLAPVAELLDELRHAPPFTDAAFDALDLEVRRTVRERSTTPPSDHSQEDTA